MECGMKCIKYLLFIFNLFFAFSGLALITIGGVIQGMYTEYVDFMGEDFFNIPIMFVVIGCIIFFVAFFGCCGAIKENHCMTMTFAFLLTIIFLLELGGGIAAYMMRDEIRDSVEDNMEEGLDLYGQEGYEHVTETWNVLQHELTCCGVTNYTSWDSTPFSEVDPKVPDSCCKEDTEFCGAGVLEMTEEEAEAVIYTDGCLEGFKDFLVENMTLIGGFAIGIALVQLLGIIFACCLASTIKGEYESV